MCENSSAPCPSMVNHQRRTAGDNQSGIEAPGETTAGAGDEEPTPIPCSHPSLPTQYISERVYNYSECGGGELWECCVLTLCTLDRTNKD